MAAQGTIQHKTVKRITFGHSHRLVILILEHCVGISKRKEENKMNRQQPIAFCSKSFGKPLKSARDTRPVGFKSFCNACQ